MPAFAMGVLTACVGGIIRDVLAGEPSHPDAAGALRDGGGACALDAVGLSLLGVAGPIAAGVAALAGFALRGLAIRRGWSLPAYRD